MGKVFTSSKVVKQYRKEFGEPDVIEIRKTFTDAKECAMWECKVLVRINAAQDERFLNRINGVELIKNFPQNIFKN